MPEEQEMWYIFGRSEECIFTEIYFPRQAAYQGTIFNALRNGYYEEDVKNYLRQAVKTETIIEEFKSYPALFDPNDYITAERRRTPVSVEEALKRIDMYKSPFFGWQTYSVDGVFFNEKTKKMEEEATQVVRIMFRFESSFVNAAIEDGCSDVMRCLMFWVLSRRGHLHEHKLWGKQDEKLFIRDHQPWPKHKLAFTKKHFTPVVKEVNKWIDDRALFIFAYLVRKFWQQVIEEGLKEDEIWVTNLFTINLNIIRPLKPQAKGESNVTS